MYFMSNVTSPAYADIFPWTPVCKKGVQPLNIKKTLHLLSAGPSLFPDPQSALILSNLL